MTTSIISWDHPGEEKLSQNELYGWIAVCIYRRVPEEKYATVLINIPGVFRYYQGIRFINPVQSHLDIWMKRTIFINFINDLLDKYHFMENEKDYKVAFIRLLNDICFGIFDESIYEERISIHLLKNSQMISTWRASKANNKPSSNMLAMNGFW